MGVGQWGLGRGGGWAAGWGGQQGAGRGKGGCDEGASGEGRHGGGCGASLPLRWVLSPPMLLEKLSNGLPQTVTAG